MVQVQGASSGAHLAACALAAFATRRALDTLGFALFGMYGAWLRAIPFNPDRTDPARQAGPASAVSLWFSLGGGGDDGSVCRRRARVLLRRTRTSPRERVRHRVFTPGVRTREVRGGSGR